MFAATGQARNGTAAGYAHALLGRTSPATIDVPERHPAIAWAESGAMALTGGADGPAEICPVPIAACADGALAALAALAGTAFSFTGAQLLGERAAIAGLRRAGSVSPGGACRLLPSADGWLAVNLARDDDWSLLPAWLDQDVAADWTALADAMARRGSADLLERGRLLGLALAALAPPPTEPVPWCRSLATGPARLRPIDRAPLVVDLTSLWAGPLAGHLLQQLGARVVKVESRSRPDGARRGAAGFYDLLNAAKASVALDFATPGGRRHLRALIEAADIVLESARPRALRQLGLDAEELVACRPGLSWISLTGYGRSEPRPGGSPSATMLGSRPASRPAAADRGSADLLRRRHRRSADRDSCGAGRLAELSRRTEPAGRACPARRRRPLLPARSAGRSGGPARRMGRGTRLLRRPSGAADCTVTGRRRAAARRRYHRDPGGAAMLIRHAELGGRLLCDVRLDHGRISEIDGHLDRRPGETVLDAAGGALLPGLHDHHLHLIAAAAARASLPCGPPEVRTGDHLAALLAAQAGTGWLRGIGYHDSVAGPIDRHWLDRHVTDRPVRIQHRSGRLWILNSAALALVASEDAPLECDEGGFTGRLYDADAWLHGRIGGTLPDLAPLSRALAAQGITGVTDATPRNDTAAYTRFAAAQESGALLQRLLVMGDASLDGLPPGPGPIARGPWKLHLHDTDPPDYDGIVADFRRSHAAGRSVAIHCVTEAELVLATTALGEAGAVPGDRIEHASVTPPALLPVLAGLGVTVVTQPNFIHERGDAYRAELASAELPWLYRGYSFLAAGIPLAAGSDAPFGRAEPWQAMQAAFDRRSAAGSELGPDEALGPGQALALFLTPLDDPGGAARRVEIGARADLCLLDRNWASASLALAESRVVATLRDGAVIWEA